MSTRWCRPVETLGPSWHLGLRVIRGPGFSQSEAEKKALTTGVNQVVHIPKKGAPKLITRAAFARLVDVSRVRVTQWLKEKKINGKAITGTGRQLRLDPDMARLQLVQNLDVAQRFGNGIGTQLADAPPPGKPPRGGSSASPSPSIEDRIRQEKLTEYEARNRRLKEQERERRGVYMRTDDARAEMAKIAAICLRVMEGGLVDLAAAMAAEFELSNRDALHLMRREFREIRTRV